MTENQIPDWDIPCIVCGTKYFNAMFYGFVYCHMHHPMNPNNKEG